MNTNQAFWDGIAQRYARKAVGDPDAYEMTLQRTESHLAPSTNVLEIGCGTGTTAVRLAPKVETYLATDLSPEMVRIAQSKVDAAAQANLEFRPADEFDPSLAGEAFDAILAFNLLHLLDDPDATTRRAYNLLKPGGVFISKTVCQPEKGGTLLFRMMRFALPFCQWIGKAPYVNFMTIAELEAKISAAGFEIIESGDYPASPPNHFVVARKL